MNEVIKKPRGFAAMSPERRREIQSKGGQNSPFNFKNRTPEQRQEAGRKGGSRSRK